MHPKTRAAKYALRHTTSRCVGAATHHYVILGDSGNANFSVPHIIG